MVARRRRGVPASHILADQAKSQGRLFTKDDTISDLENFIQLCVREHQYGYDADVRDPSRFEVLRSMNQFQMRDFLKSHHPMSGSKGLEKAYALIAPAMSITGVHLEDYSEKILLC